MGCAFSASSQDYWVDIGSVEAEEQDGVVLVPVRINKITDQGFTVPGEVGSGDNVRVWYSTFPYAGYAFDRNNTGTSNRPEIDTVSGEDYEEKSGWIRFQPGDSEKFISITLINDDKHELGEAVIIDLSFANDAEQATSADGKSAFQSSQGHVFIQNNDCYDWEVQLSEAVPPSCRLPVATAPDVEADEGEDIEISVTLDAPVRADTTFTYEFDLAPDDTDVNLARKEDFVLRIDTGRTDSNDDPIFVDNPVLFNGGIFDPTGNIVVPAGSTKESFTLPLRKRDGYEKRRETFDVTLEVTEVRGAVMVDVSTNSNTNETRPSLDWEDLPTANLADGNITASIVNVDECERGIDDSDGTGDSGFCRLHPEVILGHHNLSKDRVEGTEQRFGGRGRRNTAPSYFDEVWAGHLKVNWRLVPDTAMAGVDYTGPESGTLNIRKTGRSFVDLPFWGSSAFLIPTVNRPGVQGPRTFYVEVTPHPDNPELLFIVPERQFNGPGDADFWDFNQTGGCDTDPCRFPITFRDVVVAEEEAEEVIDERFGPYLKITDATVREGPNASARHIVRILGLEGETQLIGGVEFTYSIEAGSADSDDYYTPASASVVLDGDTTYHYIDVDIADDSLAEGAEYYTVVLTASNVTVARVNANGDTVDSPPGNVNFNHHDTRLVGRGTIEDDDSANSPRTPANLVASTSAITSVEGNIVSFDMTVEHDCGAASPVSCPVEWSDGRSDLVSLTYYALSRTASENDYYFPRGEVAVSKADNSVTLQATLLSDNITENNETFLIVIGFTHYDNSPAAVMVTVRDYVDTPTNARLVVSGATSAAEDSQVVLGVSIEGVVQEWQSDATIAVGIRTNVTGTTANHASADDFIPQDYVQRVGNGESPFEVRVSFREDTIEENSEIFEVEMWFPDYPQFPVVTTEVTIEDNDSLPEAPVSLWWGTSTPAYEAHLGFSPEFSLVPLPNTGYDRNEPVYIEFEARISGTGEDYATVDDFIPKMEVIAVTLADGGSGVHNDFVVTLLNDDLVEDVETFEIVARFRDYSDAPIILDVELVSDDVAPEEEEVVEEDNFFPGKVKIFSQGRIPEYSAVVAVGAQIDELRTENYAKLELDEDGSSRYTPVLLQTFGTGTGEGYATAGVDYRAVSTEMRMYAQAGGATINIPIVTNDGLLEGDEEFGFRVTLLNYDDPPLEATIIILDEEIESGAYISIYSGVDYDGDEGSRIEVQFQITGDYQLSRTYEVEVFTELLGDGTGYANNADFAHKSQTFTVTGGDDSAYTSFFVDTLEDESGEPAEKFGVVLRLKNAPDLATRSAAVTVTINASDGMNPSDVKDSVDEVACSVPKSSCAVDDEMIGKITAITESIDGIGRSVYVDAIAGGNCCQKCADDPIVGSNVILETLDNGLWSSGLTGGIVDADVGEYLRTLHQFTDSCAITVGVQLTYPYEYQPLYILDLEPEEATVDEGDSVLVTATLDPAQGEVLPFYLETISGTAIIDEDFVDAPLTNFEFAIGETEVEHSILTLVDSKDEDDEVFLVHLGKDGVNIPAIYSTITIIDDPANNTTDGGSRGDGGMIDKVSETVFTYTDNIDGSAPSEKANSAGQYAFLVNDTSRPKGASGRYPKLRVSDWYTVTRALDAFSLNVEDGNGTSLDCPTDLASGQNAEFDWGDGNSVGFYVYGAFVSNNGARCVFEASPSGHTGDPGQVPSGAATVTFTPAID